MKKLFIFIVVLFYVGIGADAFAAYGPDDYMIYTWGYADVMRNMLSALAGIMNSQSFFSVFKIAALLGLTVISATLLLNSKFSGMAVGSKIVFVILFQVLLTSAPYDTYISDVSKTTGTASLDAKPVLGPRGEKVPVIVAFPLSAMSSIEKGLYDIFKDTLARTEGMINVQNQRTLPITTSLNLLLATSSYRITDINLNRSLDSFVTNCIVPDIISGYYDMNAMGSSANFFNEWQDVHAMRIVNYYDDVRNDFDGWIINCPDAYVRITADLNRATGVNGEAFKQIAGSLGLASDRTIHDQLAIISRELMDYTGNAQSLMRNAIAINSFNSTYASLAAEAGVNMDGLNYGQVKSQEVARMNSTLSAVMAKKYLPLAKGYLSVIFVAIIPLIMLTGLASGSFKKPVAMVLGLLVALSLWGILEQLLDFIVTIRIGSMLEGTGGLTLANQPVVDMAVLDALSLSLGMYWMVPTLAFAIASMSGYAANSIMGGIGSSVMSGVGAAASEAAMGSRSMGVIRENMINTNKYDAARNDSTGSYSSDKSGTNQSFENINSTKLATTEELLDTSVSKTSYNKDVTDSSGNTWEKGTSDTRFNDGSTERKGVMTDSSGNSFSATAMYDKDGTMINMSANEGVSKANVDKNDHVGTTLYTDDNGNINRVFGTSSQIAGGNTIKGTGYNLDTGNASDYNVTALGGKLLQGEQLKDYAKGVTDPKLQSALQEAIAKDQMYLANPSTIVSDNKNRGSSDTTDNSTKIDETNIKRTGNITEQNLNVHNVKGGADVSGYNASNAMLKSGLSNYVDDKGIRESFINNQASYLNSFAQRSGKDTLSESQVLAATGSLSASGSGGFKLFGNGAEIQAKVAAELKANLQHGSDKMTTVDFNRIMTDATVKQLDFDKSQGIFNNSDGTFNASKYDKAAQERFEALGASLKGEYDKVYGPGNATQHVVDAVQEGAGKVMNYGAEKVDSIVKKIK